MKKILMFGFCLVFACLSAFAASPGDYPTKPIDLIVPGSAGSGSDVLTRVIAKYLSQELGVGINVLNIGGGNGIPAVQTMLTAKPDGYVLLADQALSSSYQMLIKDLPYKVEDRTFVVRFAKGPQVLCVNPNSGWKDLNDVAKFAKENPGKLIWGGISASSAADLVQLQFLKAAGIDVKKTKKISYTGGGEILSAIAGGHIMLGPSAASGVPSFAQSGMVLPVAIAGSRRIGALPNTKSAAEQGFPQVTIGFWVGISGQKDLPQKIVSVIDAASRKIILRQDFLQDLDRLGVVLDFADSAKMRADIAEEAEDTAALQLYAK